MALDFIIIPYLLGLLSAAGYIISNKVSKQILEFSFIPVLVISTAIVGFRGDYGTDYFNYSLAFTSGNTQQLGPIFTLLGIASKWLSPDVYSITPIAYLLIFTLYLAVFAGLLRSTSTVEYRIFIFYTFLFLLPSNMLGAVRQGLAFSCVLLAFMYIDKSEKKSLLFMVLAGLFHLGSIAVFPFIITYFLGLKYFRYLLYFYLSAILLVYFQLDLISQKIEFYYLRENYGANQSFYGKLLFGCYFLLFIKKPSRNIFVALALFIGSIFLPIITADYPLIADRAVIYFEMYKFMLLKVMLETIYTHKYGPWVVRSYIILLFISLAPKVYVYFSTWSAYFPFEIF